MASEITLNKGSDFRATLTYNGVDLSDYEVAIYDATSGVAFDATLTDAPNGVVTVTGEWSEDYFSLNSYWFRVKITLDGYDLTTPRIIVRLQ